MSKPQQVKAIRARVLDLYTGAYGSAYNPDTGSIVMSGDGEQLERFLRALAESFPHEKEGSTDLSWAFAHWNIANFDGPDSAAEWLYEMGVDLKSANKGGA